MKWVISGGTGFIGSKLVASLCARSDGTSIVVFTRKSRPSDHPSVRYVAWTPEEAGPWMNELDGSDVVVHLAGSGVMDKRWNAARKGELRSSRVKSTELVASAIVRAAKRPSVLVSASAVGIYGMRKDDVMCTEETPPGEDFLARLCVDWERAAAPVRDAGVRLAHPRIGIVLGPDGGALPKMAAPYKAFVGGPVGDGNQWMSWIHWKDVVRAIEFAAENSSLHGPFNAVAPVPATMNELSKTIGTVLHRPSVMRVPAFALKTAMGDEMAEAVLTGQRAVPAVLELTGFSFAYPDLRAALENCLSS